MNTASRAVTLNVPRRVAEAWPPLQWSCRSFVSRQEKISGEIVRSMSASSLWRGPMVPPKSQRGVFGHAGGRVGGST